MFFFFLIKLCHFTWGMLFNCVPHRLSFLPNDKILDWAELKAFADDKLNVAKIMPSLFDRVENLILWEKEKMFVTGIFYLFQECFQKVSFLVSPKVDILVVNSQYRSFIFF